MKKICVIGHFGFGKNLLNGQTIKTKTITIELEHQFGTNQVYKIDTHGGVKALPKIIIQLFRAFLTCRNILLFPAHNGVKLFIPLCNILNKVFHRNLHYIVIGGWLVTFLKNRNKLRECVNRFAGVYVETSTMLKELNQIGLTNIYLLKNFKEIEALAKSELRYQYSNPYKLCTFSRVMKEKGIEDIVKVIIDINSYYDEEVYKLDIYGQIDKEQCEWFEQLSKGFPPYISYKGSVQPERSVEVLRDYFMLVFPTKFYTEGIPGTIIDAYAAGLPVLSAKWESFSDVIDDGETGIGYEFGNINELQEHLIELHKNPEKINAMKSKCLEKSNEYIPGSAIQPLIDKLH